MVMVVPGMQVTLVELSKPSYSLLELLSDIEGTFVGVNRSLKGLVRELTSYEGVQARMDGIIFERMAGASHGNPIIGLLRDFLGCLRY